MIKQAFFILTAISIAIAVIIFVNRKRDKCPTLDATTQKILIESIKCVSENMTDYEQLVFEDAIDLIYQDTYMKHLDVLGDSISYQLLKNVLHDKTPKEVMRYARYL